MKSFLYAILLIAVLGCEVQSELSDSIYISDSEFPELPAYTEWGYNTFGAFYDRNVFIYSYDEIPLKVVVEDSSLSYIFQGMKGEYYGDYMALKISIPDSSVMIYQDLLVFNDTTIDLAQSGIQVEMITLTSSDIIQILEGDLYFKRSQRVFVDDAEQQIILSGYFDFDFLLNGIPSSLSNGRFDFGINNENFYRLN